MYRTKKQFERFFRAEILPFVRSQFEPDGRIDYPARRETWNNTVDAMLKDKELPRRAERWVSPW